MDQTLPETGAEFHKGEKNNCYSQGTRPKTAAQQANHDANLSAVHHITRNAIKAMIAAHGASPPPK